MMPAVSVPTLEGRVALLEQQVAQLRAELANLAPAKDWRSTVGMFAGDETMKRIEAAGRKIREADRRRAKKALSKSTRRSKR